MLRKARKNYEKWRSLRPTNKACKLLAAIQSARRPSVTADPASPRRQITALFNRVADHCVARTSAATELPAREHGRSLDQLLRSPIWNLELTCSPIHLTLERNSQGASPHRSTTIPRRLFVEDKLKRKVPDTRNAVSQARAKPAAVRRILLIPPTQEDPGVRRRVTRLTKPRGPATRIIWSHYKPLPGHPRPTKPPTIHLPSTPQASKAPTCQTKSNI